MATLFVPLAERCTVSSADGNYAIARSLADTHWPAETRVLNKHTFMGNPPVSTYYIARGFVRFNDALLPVNAARITRARVRMRASDTLIQNNRHSETGVHELNWSQAGEAWRDAFADALTAPLGAYWQNTNGLVLGTPYFSGDLSLASILTQMRLQSRTYGYALCWRLEREGAGSAPAPNKEERVVFSDVPGTTLELELTYSLAGSPVAMLEDPVLSDGSVLLSTGANITSIAGRAHAGGASQVEADSLIHGYWILCVLDRNGDGVIDADDEPLSYQAHYFGLGGDPGVNYLVGVGWDYAAAAVNLLQPNPAAPGGEFSLEQGRRYVILLVTRGIFGAYSAAVTWAPGQTAELNLAPLYPFGATGGGGGLAGEATLAVRRNLIAPPERTYVA